MAIVDFDTVIIFNTLLIEFIEFIKSSEKNIGVFVT